MSDWSYMVDLEEEVSKHRRAEEEFRKMRISLAAEKRKNHTLEEFWKFEEQVNTSSSKSDGFFGQCGGEGWGSAASRWRGGGVLTLVEGRSAAAVLEGRSSTAVVEGRSSAAVVEGRSSADVVEGRSSLKPWWDRAHYQDGGGELHQGGGRARC